MPAKTNNTNLKNTNTNNAQNLNRDNEIEALKNANKELSEKLDKLMKLFEDNSEKESNKPKKEDLVENSKEYNDKVNNIWNSYDNICSLEEINPNKQIMVMSLCYGPLCLSDEMTGKTILKFTKYGETKPILYSSLMSVVNSNLSFAQSGRFYILNKEAVYHLGLSEFYKNIIPADIIDNITSYPQNTIELILKNIPKEQKDTIVRTLSDDVYNGRNVDVNKVVFISNIIGTDIISKANEKKQFDNLK